MKQLALDIGLAPVATLESFVPGGNDAALAHVRLWVEGAARSPVPTLLWGESGSGKTHLLLAARHAMEDRGWRVGWLDADSPPGQPFDDGWDAVIMDDCHLFNTDQQATAFNWFINALAPAHGTARWVLASTDRPPADLPLRDDLRTRLGWGDVFALQVPGEEDRRTVLRRTADARGVVLSPDVMEFMLTRFSRDLGSLLQLLDQLDVYALRTQRAITIPLIKSMLDDE